MDRQKLPPPVSTKITRKLASESTEHNSLLNFYSSISTDETGAPKRWKMSTSVQFDEDVIASGKSSPVPNRSTPSRDSSTERKSRPGSKRGGKDKDSIDIVSSRESSLEGKDKGKVASDSKRDSSSENSKVKKTEEVMKKLDTLDKAKFYGPKANSDTPKPKRGRPKSLDLSSKQINGEDDSFKSPDPLTPCNIAVKRRKGRPKETPPTLVAENPVEPQDLPDPELIATSSMTQTDFENEEVEADVEDNVEVVVKRKRGRPSLKLGQNPKGKPGTVTKMLGHKKQFKGQRLISKLKKKRGRKPKIQTVQGDSKISSHSSAPSVVVKKRIGRPPGAKNKATILKEQMLAKQLENQLKMDRERSDDQTVTLSATQITATDVTLSSNSEDLSLSGDTLQNVPNDLKNKALGVREGGIKSLGKLKKETFDMQKVRKKRILNSYAANSDISRSLDHLPKNDLRRYLQMKLIERLNGNRSSSHTMLKNLSDTEEKKSEMDDYSEDDSLPAPDPMRDSDIQNLSALVEQKRVRSESDASTEQRRSLSRSRKSSIDLSKFSDNESISSELSTNSFSASKRIFVLGEDNAESDDTIRTRQRVEIIPGKTRKRTLSGEFDLVDEYQLRKEKKLARLSGGSTVPFDINIDRLQARSEKTPVVTPVKRKQKTSPKIIAIKQRLEAKRESSSPFVSELRKRLLKQSPFLSRMRRKKRRLLDKRNVLDKDFSANSTHLIHPDNLESEEKEIQEKLTKLGPSLIDNNSEIEKQCVISAKMKVGNKLSVEAEIHYNGDESKLDSYQNEVKHETENDADTHLVDDKPLTVENMIHAILMQLVDNVILTCEPDLKENEAFSLAKTNDDKSVIEANLNDILSVPVKRKAGRPRKIKKHFGRLKKSAETVKVTTGARRGRKPKSAQPKESPESIIVRKFELRQKISRSPLDNIALKQSIEESEYYKNEVQRANRKENKLKSKRVYAPVVEEYSLPFESSETSTEFYQTDAETESEMSDFGFDSATEPRTLEDYINECRPCSVVVTDFIKQLQLAQQKNTDSVDEDSLLETEDSGDDSVEHAKGEDRKKNETIGNDASESKTVTSNVVKDKFTGSYKEKTFPDYSSRINMSSLSSPKQDGKSGETSDKVNSADTNAFSTPKALKIKTPQSKKKTSSPKAKKSTPEHQTARKTVPPLKIKLKGGSWGKTYMVESSHSFDSRLSSHHVEKPFKKKKSKSSSKSGSDSDRGNKIHHHHHHRKKRNKSPLVGQISAFGEKKSKPTAIVAASPAVKQSPLPKGAYEATFLEFIQNKEKDDASLPLPGKQKPFYEVSKFKEYKVDTEGNLMVTASCFSQTDTSSTPSITESKSQASLYNSLSKNSTSSVKSSMSDSVQKSLEHSHEDNQKKDNQLFIGVIGPRSNLHYFCSVCEGEMHKTDDLVLKHFAVVHPGKPIMYRRVAGEANQKDKSQHGSVFERVHTSTVIGDTSKTVLANENRALKSGLAEGDQSFIPSQVNGTNLSSSNRLENPQDDSKRVSEREEDEESDSGSLNLKIVDVVSLKDQLHALDPEDQTQHQKQPGVKINTQGSSPANTVYTPELKIPHIPRSASSFPGSQDQSQLSNQRSDRVVSNLTSVRKTPGLIKPGRLCNTFKCETCNVHAPVLAAMVAHLRNTHTEIPRLFQCPYCRNEEAETEAQIHQHIRKLHPTDNPNPPVALSERAKKNLRTLSVRVPDNKAIDTSFLEKDIYMCLNCKVHMPSLEAIYDHLEQVHTEVFVFVCSACKVFKSKSEQDVIQHIESEARCNQNQEKNVSLAIDGNQFIRVPCLIKDKNKTRESRLQQPKVSQNTTHTSVSKPLTSQNSTQPSSIVQALQNQPFAGAQFLRPGLPMQQIFQSPYGQLLTPPIVPQQPQNQLIPMALSQTPLVLSTVVSPVSHTSGIAISTSTSTLTASSQAPLSSSLPISSVKPSVSSAPSKPPAPTGAKKRKNLLESIQHIKMQKQLEQQAKLESEKASASELGPLATSTAAAVTESSINVQAPPPLIRGPPPLIRFDQLNQVPGTVVASAQSGVIPQQTVKQLSSLSKSDATKLVGPPRQIQSSLFDTSDPDAFKPVQRVPVLNVPSVPRSARIPTPSSSAIGVTQKSVTSGSAPLDLSKTTPTNSPASTPPAQDRAAPQKSPEINNPELYNVFNLKPSTQAQLPKQALQNKGAVHQLPPKAPAPPQLVRPNASNTLAYRPQQPHIATTQVPQVINMPVGMLNNIVVTMPSFQVVQGMPTQYIRMSGTQLMSSPAGPVSVAVAVPNTKAPRPVLTSQQTPFQQPMNVNLPIFKCPYCPKLTPLTFNQVQPHIESQHPGCSVVLMPIENKKQS